MEIFSAKFIRNNALLCSSIDYSFYKTFSFISLFGKFTGFKYRAFPLMQGISLKYEVEPYLLLHEVVAVTSIQSWTSSLSVNILPPFSSLNISSLYHSGSVHSKRNFRIRGGGTIMIFFIILIIILPLKLISFILTILWFLTLRCFSKVLLNPFILFKHLISSFTVSDLWTKSLLYHR